MYPVNVVPATTNLEGVVEAVSYLANSRINGHLKKKLYIRSLIKTRSSFSVIKINKNYTVFQIANQDEGKPLPKIDH